MHTSLHHQAVQDQCLLQDLNKVVALEGGEGREGEVISRCVWKRGSQKLYGFLRSHTLGPQVPERGKYSRSVHDSLTS